MKKGLILLGFAIVALSSCTKDTTKVVNNGHAIDFRAATTKGASLDYTYDLNSFFATAIDATDANYFTNAGYARVGEYFTSNPAYYWPADGSTLTFYAFSPSAESLGATVSISASEQKLYGVTPEKDINDQVDMVVAKAQGSKADEATGVMMNFSHRFSQIRLEAKNTNSDYEYKVAGVRINNLIKSGDFDFSDNSWDLGTDLEDYTLEYAQGNEITVGYSSTLLTRTENANNSYDTNNAIVLPQTLTAWNPENDPENNEDGAYLAVKINICAATGDQIFPATEGEYEWVAAPVACTLEEGNKYVFRLDFSYGAGYTDPDDGPTSKVLDEDIKFTLSVNALESPSEGASIRKALEGNWLAKKIEITYEYPEGFEESNKNTPYSYDTENEVKSYFNDNGFYKFTVDNDYNLYTTTPDGTSGTTKFTVDDDGYIYLEAYDNHDGTYDVLPRVKEIKEDTQECIIELREDNYYNNTRYDRVETITYDRK